MFCLSRSRPFHLKSPINKYFHATPSSHKQHISISRQSKIFQKLIGNRESGSKKRWYPVEQQTSTSGQQSQLSIRDLGKTTNKQGKNASRRINVLNKLFMKHITDQLAIGSVSDQILGKGLEISRVKITSDFNGVNVYWIAKGGACSDAEIETTLHRCTGILRHELSQLRLMGQVPRIYFVKDKLYANLEDIDYIFRNCDLGDDYEEFNSETHQLREELSITNSKDEFKDIPPMRHDVFGLNHKAIMTGILAKLKKSKDAWESYNTLDTELKSRTSDECATPRLDAIREKMEAIKMKEDKFNKFLNTRMFKQSTPERKRPIEVVDEVEVRSGFELEHELSAMREDSDYIEEIENKKY